MQQAVEKDNEKQALLHTVVVEEKACVFGVPLQVEQPRLQPAQPVFYVSTRTIGCACAAMTVVICDYRQRQRSTERFLNAYRASTII